jgi:hypothetical protein
MYVCPLVRSLCCGLAIGLASVAAYAQHNPAEDALRRHYEMQELARQAVQPSPAQLQEQGQRIQEMNQAIMRRLQQQADLMSWSRTHPTFQPPPVSSAGAPIRSTGTVGSGADTSRSPRAGPTDPQPSTVTHMNPAIRWLAIVLLLVISASGLWWAVKLH